MSDTLLAILHMCIFPGGAFALLVAMVVLRKEYGSGWIKLLLH